MTDIVAGDWIKVPKGSHLIKDYTGGNYGEGKKPTSRDIVVQVSQVTDIDEHYFRTQLSKEDYEAYRTEIYQCQGGNTWGNGHTDETRATAQARAKAARDLAVSKMPNGATKLIHWSNDKKAVLDIVAQKVPAPPPKKKAEIKVNKRQQMVNKSRWKFTVDHDLTFEVDNPPYIQAERDFRMNHQYIGPWVDVRTPHGIKHIHCDDLSPENRAKYDALVASYNTALAANKAHLATMPKFLTKVVRRIKAGEIFTVDGKFQTTNPYGYGLPDVGAIARVIFDGDTDPSWLPYKQIVDVIEAESIPTVNIYVLRNKTTGLFYMPASYDPQATRLAQEEAQKLAKPGEYADYDYVYTQNYTDTFMKAKHFDGLGRAKTQILMMTGYYNGLPGADESLPEWAGGGGSFVMSDDWELVHFDKLARQEVGVVADFQEWYKRAWELRELTVKYGSSVRTAYKALEKANLLDSQKGMVVFTETDEEKLDNVGYYDDDKTAITKEEQTLIDAAIASTQMKKGTFKKATDHCSVAVSFPNKGAAMMFKLAYNGKLKTTVLDLETLKEAVDG